MFSIKYQDYAKRTRTNILCFMTHAKCPVQSSRTVTARYMYRMDHSIHLVYERKRACASKKRLWRAGELGAATASLLMVVVVLEQGATLESLVVQGLEATLVLVALGFVAVSDFFLWWEDPEDRGSAE